MSEPSERERDWKRLRQKIIGLGETSARKSYYPELQQRLRELQESEVRFRAIFNAANDAIFVYDMENGAILDVNRKMIEMYGYAPEEARKLSIGDLSEGKPPYTQADATGWLQKAAEGNPQVFEWRAKDKSGRLFWVEVNLTRAVIAGKDRILAVIRDISSRKQVEEVLRKLNRTLRMLSQVNEVLIRASDEPALLNEVCQAIVDIGGYTMAWIGYAKHDAEKTVLPVARAGYDAGYLDAVPFSWADSELGHGPVGTAIRSGKPVLAGDLATDPTYAPWREEALSRGYRSAIAVPLVHHGETLGALGLYADRLDAFDSEEVNLLIELAGDLSYGIAALRTREALGKSEAEYRTIVDTAQEGILVMDKRFFVTYANQRLSDMLGYPVEEILGRSLLDFVDAQTREPMLVHFGRRQRGISENYEMPFRRKDGSVLWGLISATALFDDKHEFAGSFAMLTDITERKRVSEHKREFYRRTILAATDGKLEITDRETIERIAGPSIANWEIIHAEDLSPIRQAVGDMALAAGMDQSRVFEFVLCIGEATTNALKHAGRGTASLHCMADGFMFVVSDQGPGIEALALPEVALKRGYTTAISLGMGYKEMISLANRVYLSTGPGGTTVAIQMDLSPAKTPPLLAALGDTWNL